MMRIREHKLVQWAHVYGKDRCHGNEQAGSRRNINRMIVDEETIAFMEIYSNLGTFRCRFKWSDGALVAGEF